MAVVFVEHLELVAVVAVATVVVAAEKAVGAFQLEMCHSSFVPFAAVWGREGGEVWSECYTITLHMSVEISQLLLWT